MSLQDYISEKPVIHTEHLILRTMNKNDIADLKKWMGDVSLYEYWGKRPSKSEENPELLFEKQDSVVHFCFENTELQRLWRRYAFCPNLIQTST